MTITHDIDHSNLESIQTESENIREETKKALADAKKFLDNIKQSGNTEKYLSALEEYNEVGIKYQEVTSDNILTQGELGDLRQEINEVRDARGDLWETFDGEDLWEKSVDDLNTQEAEFLLKLTQQDFKKYENEDLNFAQKGLATFTNSFSEVSNRVEMNILQEELLRRIHGDSFVDNGYDADILLGYNNEIGNHVIDIPRFETDLKNKAPNEWNSQALVHFFEKHNPPKAEMLSWAIQNFGVEQLLNLQKLWTKESAGPAKKKLTENPQTSFLINGISDIQVDEVLTNPDTFKNFSQVFDAMSTSDIEKLQEEIIEILINKPDEFEHILNGSGNLDNTEGFFKATILQARIQIHGRNFINQIEYIYSNSDGEVAEEIVGHLRAVIEISLIQDEDTSTDSFDYNAINGIIKDHNKEHGTSYPLIGSNFKSTIRSLLDVQNLSNNYEESIRRSQELSENIQEIKSKLLSLRKELQIARKEGEEKEIVRIQTEIRHLSYQMKYLGKSADEIKKIGTFDDILKQVDLSTGIIDNELIKESAYDFSNNDTVELILKDTSRIKFITKTDDILLFVEKAQEKGKKIYVGDLAHIHKGDWSVLNKISSFNELDIQAIPHELWKYEQIENNIHSIIKKSHGAEYALIQQIIEHNQDTENIQKLYNLAQDDRISKYQRHYIRKALLHSKIVLEYLSQEDYTILTQIDINEKGLRESFDAVFRKIRLNNPDTKIESNDKNIIQKYIENFGIQEIKSQIQVLIKNPQIELSYIKSFIYDLDGSEDEYEVIKSLIDFRGMGAIQKFSSQLLKNNFVTRKCLEDKGLETQKEYIKILNFSSPESINILLSLHNNDTILVAKLLLGKFQTNEDIKKCRDSVFRSTKLSKAQKDQILDVLFKIPKTFQSQRNIINKLIKDINNIQKGLEHQNDVSQKAFITRGLTVFSEKLQVNFEENTNLEQEIQSFLNNFFTKGNSSKLLMELEDLCNNDLDIATKILAEISQLNINVKGSDNDLLEGQLSQIGYQESQNKFSALFEKGEFSLQILQKEFNIFSQQVVNKNLSYEEIYKAYILKLKPSEKQQIILEEIFKNNESILESTITRTEEGAQKAIEAARSGKFEDWKNKTFKDRIESGNIFVGEKEISGEEIFDYESGKLLPNPDYTPPEKNSDSDEGDSPTNKPEIPSFFSPITERVSFGENGNYILSTDSGEIPITPTDLTALDNNPEAEANFIEFYNTLQNLNLEEFWNYKDIIFQTISNSSAASGLNLNDKGYIDKSDMALFLYTIADSVSESPDITDVERNDINSMRGQKQDYELIYSMIERVNRQTGLAKDGDESILRGNEGRLGKIFREMYFSKDSDKNAQSLLFKKEDFQENIG